MSWVFAVVEINDINEAVDSWAHRLYILCLLVLWTETATQKDVHFRRRSFYNTKSYCHLIRPLINIYRASDILGLSRCSKRIVRSPRSTAYLVRHRGHRALAGILECPKSLLRRKDIHSFYHQYICVTSQRKYLHLYATISRGLQDFNREVQYCISSDSAKEKSD
jgi:hypothetical protein